jgi:hypothetical protein
MHKEFRFESLRVRNHSKDVGVDGRIEMDLREIGRDIKCHKHLNSLTSLLFDFVSLLLF